MPGLSDYTLWERLRLARALRAVDSPDSTSEAIAELQRLTRERPSDWLFWYTLAYLHLKTQELVYAVRCAEEAYELRPKDKRSPYALATCLRQLAFAKLDAATYQMLADQVDEWSWEAGVDSSAARPPSPEVARRALAGLGISIEAAVERSMTLFHEAALRSSNRQEQGHIQDNIAALALDFPEIEAKVLAARPQGTGLLAPSIDDPFNTATHHYRKIRYLAGNRDAQAREVLQVISYCQQALRKSPGHGDAKVLLANAFSIAAGQARFVYPDAYDWFLTRAVAIIEEWRVAGGYSKNRDIGLQLHSSIVNELNEERGFTRPELESAISRYRQAFYKDSLTEQALEQVRALLDEVADQ